MLLEIYNKLWTYSERCINFVIFSVVIVFLVEIAACIKIQIKDLF